MEEGATPAKRPGFFVRLFRGDVGLARTFWFFGFAVPILLFGGVTFGLISFAYAADPGTMEGPIIGYFYALAYISLAVGYVAYAVFMYIAIWRSARKYTGLKLWKFLAQVWVICGIVSWMRLIPYALHQMPA